MDDALAFVGEPNAALRRHIAASLQGVGYTVRQCARVQELSRLLRSTAAYVIQPLVVVIATDFAARCNKGISKLGRARAAAGLSRPLLVLSCAPKPLRFCLPVLDGCDVAVVLLDAFNAQGMERWAERLPFFVRTAGVSSIES
jgi:hypothetical protein